jgi:hypothetical protein
MKTKKTDKQQRPDQRLETTINSLMKQRVLAFTVVVFICCAGIVMASRAFTVKTPKPITLNPAFETKTADSTIQTAATGRTRDHVSHGALWSQLQEAFRILGDRLEKPGKERLTFTGTLEKMLDSQSVNLPFRLVWELPGRLRFEELSGAQSQVFTFNGTTIAKLGGSLSQQDYNQLETLLYDTAEHFFIGRVQGQSMRYLGGRFSATGEDEAGPAYELYEVVDHIRTTPEGRQQIKHYYFNSDTQLLEKVRYKLAKGDATVSVEVQLTNWSPYEKQQFPARIIRLENDKPVFTLTINAIGISPKVEDGIFAAQSR